MGSSPSQRQLTPEEAVHLDGILANGGVHGPAPSSKRLRHKSLAPAVPGLRPADAGSSNVGQQAIMAPAAPGMRPPAPAVPGPCPTATGGSRSSPFVAVPFTSKYQCSNCEFQLTCLTEEAAGIASTMNCPKCKAPVRQCADLPAAPGLCPAANSSSSNGSSSWATVGSSSEQQAAMTSPTAPGLCPQAVGSGAAFSGDASSVDPPTPSPHKRLRQKSPAPEAAGLSQQLTIRGLNIQYPFSQLILLGCKTEEIRTYPLGRRGIAEAGEQMFLIETPGAKNAHGALLEGANVGPPPQHAQVVGTVAFSSSRPYANISEWQGDRQRHRIAEGSSRYDWDGSGDMYAWHVDEVQRFSQPVPAGQKSQIGYRTPRTLEVKLQSASSAS